MGGFLAGLFGGSSPVLNKAIDQSQQVSGFETGLGEKQQTKSANITDALMSGDPAAIAQILGPQMSAANQQAQQAKQTGAQFGTRSGGTTAGMAGLDDRTRAMITDMIARLTGGAVDTAAAQGAGDVQMGMAANKMATDEAQQRLQNWQNSILGQGLTKAAQFAESAGLGAAGGAMSSMGADPSTLAPWQKGMQSGLQGFFG